MKFGARLILLMTSEGKEKDVNEISSVKIQNNLGGRTQALL